jgi:glycosyltransferase involved in cell wall biosynthesis
METVSVIIPTYNRADLIGQAIDSVLAQAHQQVEVIVADDGSTDDTAAVVGAYGDRVRYLPLPHRGLPAATRNAGIRAATGDLLAFLDSDDLFLPNKLAVQAAALVQNLAAGVAYANGVYFRTTPDAPVGRVQDGLPTPSGWVFGDLLAGNFLAPPVVLVRRTVLDEVGLFDESPDFFAVEDFDLWLRLAAHTPFVYTPGDVAAIRRHAGGISRHTARLRSGVLNVLAACDRRFPALMQQHAAARHEAYALSYGAVTAAELRERHWRPAINHSLHAGSHLLQMPGLGLPALRAWRRRSRVRRDSAR